MRDTIIPDVDRRRLLQSAAAIAVNPKITVASPVAPTVDLTPPSPPKLAVAPWLAQITRRNELRRQAGLPLLSVATELRRIKSSQADHRWATFAAAFRPLLRAKLLSRRRRQCGDPAWQPHGWFAGIEFESALTQQLHRLYQRIGRDFVGTSSLR